MPEHDLHASDDRAKLGGEGFGNEGIARALAMIQKTKANWEGQKTHWDQQIEAAKKGLGEVRDVLQKELKPAAAVAKRAVDLLKAVLRGAAVPRP
jgi:predicted NBD/HSP70 family sugar kinase